MKRIFDLPHSEILLLSQDQEQINRFISIEFMIAGISLSPEPENIGFKVPEPDLDVWELCHLTFSNRESASRVLKEIIENKESLIKTEYDYSYGATFNIGPLKSGQYPFPSIEEKRIYSGNVKKAEIKKMLDLQKEYDLELKEWNKVNESRNEIQFIVSDFINIHYLIDDMKNRYQIIYDTYLQNADGNDAIARRFFDKNEVFQVIPF